MSERMRDGLFIDLESSYQMDALHRRISVDELWRYFLAERAEVERLSAPITDEAAWRLLQ